MKRSSSVLIGLLSAAITIGSLFAIVGPKYLGKHACNHYEQEQCDGKNNVSSNHNDLQKPGEK